MEGKDPTALARCSVQKSQSSPLVTEWPASEKANLESRLQEGAVVVTYSGCEMRLLPQCKPGGRYLWNRTTLAEDTVEIRNEEDLYAKLPLGAASLEGELKSSGRLAVRTTVVGQMKLDGVATADVSRTGDCAGATHVIASLSVGAFRLMAGGATKLGAGITTPIASTGGSTSSEEILVRKAGDPARCADTSHENVQTDCSSPIQVFLWPLPKLADAPGSDDGAGPAVPGAVRVNFILPDASEKWRVMDADKVLCEVPCTRWTIPGKTVTMRRDGATASDTLNIDLPTELGGYSAGRTVDALPKPATPLLYPLGFTGVVSGVFALAFGTGMKLGGEGKDDWRTVGAAPTLIVGGILLAAGLPTLLLSRQTSSISLTLADESKQTRRTDGGWKVLMGPGFMGGRF
jgi:hypothetical protein